MTDITLRQAQELIARGEEKWQELDSKVAKAFARYNDTVSGEKFGNLYGREYNSKTDKFDGNFVLLEYPVRFERLLYYVTEEFPAVYKRDARTGKYRESKTAYKAIQACERAIDKAIDRREYLEDTLDKCKKLLPKIEKRERALDFLADVMEHVG